MNLESMCMANTKNNASSQETRRKLVDAAGKVFAERGLHAATLKEITELAGVNPAAVNYHFSDKAELYAAVVRYSLSQMATAVTDGRVVGTPEEQLRDLIGRVIADAHDPARPSWRITMIAHELNQPTAATEAVMDELIWPTVRYIKALIREILGVNAAEEQIALGAFSVISQIAHYLYHTGLFRRCNPELAGPENAEKLVAQIVSFSLAGLHAMRDQGMDSNRPGAGAVHRVTDGYSVQSESNAPPVRRSKGRRPTRRT